MAAALPGVEGLAAWVSDLQEDTDSGVDLWLGWVSWSADSGTARHLQAQLDALADQGVRVHGEPEMVRLAVDETLTVTTRDGTRLDLRQTVSARPFGSDDYEDGNGIPVVINARVDGDVVGGLEYELKPHSHVRFIATNDEYARRGVATAIMDWGSTAPDGTTNGFTDAGSCFFDARAAA